MHSCETTTPLPKGLSTHLASGDPPVKANDLSNSIDFFNKGAYQRRGCAIRTQAVQWKNVCLCVWGVPVGNAAWGWGADSVEGLDDNIDVISKGHSSLQRSLKRKISVNTCTKYRNELYSPGGIRTIEICVENFTEVRRTSRSGRKHDRVAV